MIVRKYLSTKKIVYYTWKKVVVITIVSSLVTVAYHYYDCKNLQVPIEAFGILGTALAILLGFRNNSAYDRWWEARRLWGTVVNESRSIGRQTVSFFTLKHAPEGSEAERHSMIKEIVYRQIAFAYSLTCHLRKQDPLKDIRDFVSAGELEALKQEKNVPVALLTLQAMRLKDACMKGYIEDYRHMQIDARLTSLNDALGGCERIKNTIFPRQYSYYTTAFTWIFILLMPFVLVPKLDFMTPAFCILIGFIFFVLETVGTNIESPFENSINDTPMSALSRTIEINLRQQLGEQELPEPVLPVDGFLY